MRDDLIFVIGLSVSIGFTQLAHIIGISAFWISLCMIVCLALYFSFVFFKSSGSAKRLYEFLLLTLLLIVYFAIIYKSFGVIDSSTGEVVTGSWKNAIYFSVVTWTTLGYGDYHPVEFTKVWVMAEAMIGYLFMGLLVGKIMHLAAREDQVGTS